MQTVNIASNDFGEIRREDSVYIDKTAWFHRLASNEGRKMFFLAHPRRFGKSLTISTLEAMFQERRRLFGGLAIMNTDWDWRKKHPVIHLDMEMCVAEDYDRFSANLPECVKHGLAGAYAAMPGYTEGELDRYFSGHMEAHRKVMERGELVRALRGRSAWLHGKEAARASLRTLPEVPLAGTGLLRGSGGLTRGRAHGHRGGPPLRHVRFRVESRQTAEGRDVAGAAQKERRAVPYRRQAGLGGWGFRSTAGPASSRAAAPRQ